MWEGYDNDIDAKALNDDAESISDYQEVPLGKYEVKCNGLSLVPTKEKGNPMVKLDFIIVAGDFERQHVFINQVLIARDQNDKFRVHTCNELLRGLDTALTPKVAFTGVANYAQLVEQIAPLALDQEYLLEISERKKFRTYKLLEHYVEDPAPLPQYVTQNQPSAGANDPIPF